MMGIANSASTSLPEALTSEERWRRWEQRGLDNDARFSRRLRRVVWTAVTVVAVLLLVWQLR